MRSFYWQAMPKVKKKSDKQRQKLVKVRKRDDRATNEKAVSKTCVEKSSIPSVDVHVANNNLDGTPYMSNRGELASRNFAAVDSPNVSSEAQAIVDKYLQSQNDLADRAKKNYTDCHSVQESASDRCNERSVKCKEMRQQYNAEWKRHARSLPEFREYEQRNRVKMQMARKNPVYRDTERECNKKMKMDRKDAAYTRTGILRKKKKKKMARKDATYRDLVKIFKSWQVSDWLAKWIIMVQFMDLRWPRVFRRSNVGLVPLTAAGISVTSYICFEQPALCWSIK